MRGLAATEFCPAPAAILEWMSIRPLKRLLRRVGFQLSLLLSRHYARGGMRSLRRAGERLGTAHFYLTPLKTRKLQAQMTRIFGPQHEGRPIRQILKSACRDNDRAMVEIVAFSAAAISPEQLTEGLEVSGVQALQEALDSERGAILLGLHMGNGIALLVHLAALGLPVSAVPYQSRKLPADFFQHMFSSTGIETIPAYPPMSAFHRIAKSLQRGRAVFIPMDQTDKHGGIPAWFLGKRLGMPVGAASLARAIRVPVFPVLPLASNPGWTFRIGAPLWLDRSQPLAQSVEQLTGIIDGHIREFPELWSWHHRRWHRHPFPSAK